MVTVPKVTGPSVAPDAARPIYQQRNVSSVDFGGGGARSLMIAGRAFEQGAADLARIGLDIQIEDNERALKALDIQFSEERRKILLGDGTPENPGFYALQGEAAITAAPAVQEQLQKIRTDLLGSTTNQRVQTIFGETSVADLNADLGSIARHTTAERITAANAISDARINEARQNAAAYHNDPVRFQKSLAIVKAEIASQQQTNGWSDEVAASKLEEEQTALWTNTIQAAAQQDVASARALFEANKDQIDGDIQIKLEQDLRQAENAERIQREHEEALARQRHQDSVDGAFDEYVSRMINGEPVDIKAIAADPRLAGEGSTKIMLWNVLDGLNKAPTATEVTNSLATDFFARINLPEGDPRKITSMEPINAAMADPNSGMTRETFDWLKKAFVENQSPDGQRITEATGDFFSGMKSQITKSNPLMGVTDPTGDAKFYEYQRYVQDTMAQARERGEDPWEYLRPGSPKYLGSPAAMAPFQKTMEQSLDTALENINRRPEPRSPETIDTDYKSLEELTAAQKAGEITYQEAVDSARRRGWVQ